MSGGSGLPGSPSGAPSGAPGVGGAGGNPLANRVGGSDPVGLGQAPRSDAASPTGQALENKGRELAAEAGKRAAQAYIPGAQATGLDKVAGKIADEVAGKIIKQVAAAATSIPILVVAVILALFVGTLTVVEVVSMNSDEFPLPGDPATMKIHNARPAVKTAEDLMPDGWAQVVYRAQQDGADPAGTYGVPWTVLAGLARAQSDFGRRSPYDTLDRDPNRDPQFGSAPGAVGSSGLPVAASTYQGPVLLLGDPAAAQIGAALTTKIPNAVTPGPTTNLHGAAAQLPKTGDAPDVVAVYFPVPTTSPAETTADLERVVQRLGQGTTVLWVNALDPTHPRSTAAYTAALHTLAQAHSNVHVVDWATAPGAAHQVTPDGALRPEAYSRIARMLATQVQSASASTAWVWPLANGAGTLTAGFGQGGDLWAADHTGQDFAAPVGVPIRAVADGVVTATDLCGDKCWYGNIVKIQHADGIETWYAHMSRIDVTPGTRVTAGTVIGAVGAVGNVTGPHLHLEVHVAGQPVDPMKYVPAHPTGTVSAAPELGTDVAPAPFGWLAHRAHSYPGQPTSSQLLADTSPCPVAPIEPPIGGGRKQAAGPFLLRPAALADMASEHLDPNDPCAQATYVAKALGHVVRDLVLKSDYSDWQHDDAQAKALWSTAISTSGIFADSTTGKTDCSIDYPVTATNLAYAIRSTFTCTASLQSTLNVATQVSGPAGQDASAPVQFETLTGADAADQLATEAIGLSAAAGPHPLASCRSAARYAGVIPLTRPEAARLGISDRCDAAEVITAVAAHVVAGESTAVVDRPVTGGPFAPMLGGWSGISAATGIPVHRFAQRGPFRPWAPSAACQAQMQAQVTELVTRHGDELAALPVPLTHQASGQVAALFASAADPQRSACRSASVAQYYAQLSVIADGLAEAQPDTPPTGGPTSGPTPGADPGALTPPTLNDPGAPASSAVSPAATQTAAPYLVLGAYADSLAVASDTTHPAHVGRDALVPRLATESLRFPAAADLGYDTAAAPGSFPLSGVAVAYAHDYGGLRPEWDSATGDVLEAAGLSSTVGFSAGAAAATAIAAAKSQLGVPYSWGGGGPAGPSYGIVQGANIRGFDCSGLMEYAYSKAGYQIGGTSNSQKSAGQSVGSLADALPGDLLFWGAPTTYHVAMYLGNSTMIEAPHTGDVVKISPVRSGITYIRRIVPADAGGGLTAGPDAVSLSAKLPAEGRPYASLFTAAGSQYHLDAALLASMAAQESGFRAEVITCQVGSSAGARGIMQFMPATAAGLHIDPCDPSQAVGAAARYLREQVNRFGSVRTALAAYNYGPGNVSSGRPWPAETQSYVQEIPARCRTYGGC